MTVVILLYVHRIKHIIQKESQIYKCRKKVTAAVKVSDFFIYAKKSKKDDSDWNDVHVNQQSQAMPFPFEIEWRKMKEKTGDGYSLGKRIVVRPAETI